MTELLTVEDLKKHYPLGGSGGMMSGLVTLFRKANANVSDKTPILHAVDGVSFTIGRGESLGLVGESGCGKSTLVSMLARLSDPTEGVIRFNDQEISGIPANDFYARPERTDIQIVFQDPHESLNPRFTSFDTIAEPLKRLKGFKSGAELTARVAEVARQVDLPEQLLSRFPHQLSGGQKARVNIARAIAVEPKLLILDEPTSALDVSVQAVILKLLVRLKTELGMSYLFVSHDLNVVRLLCDRVIVMYLGQIVESGTAKAIFDQPSHPYTRALISAIPGLADPSARTGRLTGDPKSPINPDPNACRFHGRCPEGQELCGRKAPPTVNREGNHFAVCHFVDDQARKRD
ncbi:MAG: ABC transporter ATP-binding protein [Magnetovibrionaceae bacterium]